MRPLPSTLLTLTALTAGISAASAQPLTLKNYFATPEHFGVSSTLIEGEKEVLLVNAQFSKSEALRIAADILDSGKTLKTIFVSYGDPDFYFGLDVFKQYFPDVKIIATPETVKHIQSTYALKMRYWAPQMGANAPSTVIVPQAYTAKTIRFEQQDLQIKGQNELTYLWLPAEKAVVGGIAVTSGTHLWMADTPTVKDRTEVVNTLKSIQALRPKIVVPAHSQANAPQNLSAVNFSLDYFTQYEKAVSASKNSQQLIHKMKQAYPNLEGESSLELGAKVVKGEMKWP